MTNLSCITTPSWTIGRSGFPHTVSVTQGQSHAAWHPRVVIGLQAELEAWDAASDELLENG